MVGCLRWDRTKRSTSTTSVTAVSRRPADEDSPPALLIDGARRGPIEDSGGLPGYEEIVDALADPSYPDHAAWVADMTGSDVPFNPAFLEIAAVNRALAKQF